LLLVLIGAEKVDPNAEIDAITMGAKVNRIDCL
jgi:hypothetical protein